MLYKNAKEGNPILYKFKQWIGFLFRNLQIRIIVSIVILVFAAVFLSLNISFKHTETLFEQETSDLLISNLEQVGNQVENVTLDMMKLSNVLSLDDTITSNLNAFIRSPDFKPFSRMKLPQELTSEDYSRMSRIENRLNFTKNNNFFNYNAHMIIISSDGIISNVMGNIVSDVDMNQEYLNFKQEFGMRLNDDEWFTSLVRHERETVWMVPYMYHSSKLSEDKQYVSLAKSIKSSITGETLGIVMINLDLDNFVSLFTVRSKGSILLLDSQDQIIKTSGEVELNDIHNVKKDLKLYGTQRGYFIGDSDGKRYMVTYYILNRLNWTIVSVIPYEDVMKNTSSLKNKVLTINYLVFGLFLLSSVALILYITNPLKLLIKDLRKKKIGVYSLGTKDITYSNDVNSIVRSFDQLFKRIDELVLKVVEEQRREQELKYEALKAQINPHFLFNTLNIIKWTAMMNGAVNASNMIADLGRLLEVSMKKGEEEITLKEEIHLVRAYMNIQNTRFNDSIELNIEINPILESYQIIKLLLQPVVENCILHGLKNKKIGGRIEIGAQLYKGRLRIDVTDNGEGIEEHRIQEIFNVANEEFGNPHKFSGVGLRNIHDRLQLKYGEQFGLRISSSLGQGTTVSVMIPALQKEETLN
ncbi:sensor histidine kinase [Paenibacillus alginolyticus]|uniref:histidine kinase n=1 Tax=Paenibacillus alginolyticus TaxID=59839 RepID=A0ABT4GAS9_9BACL|nr:sensor histidine kinase [Paenibacillus alginolyticus]MCY9693234.1 sensor histidine kinase [Paenibacillus alginolyticus]MEC0145997.1 sensor histidine kinase [Paenibacillus alginolyticus]